MRAQFSGIFHGTAYDLKVFKLAAGRGEANFKLFMIKYISLKFNSHFTDKTHFYGNASNKALSINAR